MNYFYSKSNDKLFVVHEDLFAEWYDCPVGDPEQVQLATTVVCLETGRVLKSTPIERCPHLFGGQKCPICHPKGEAK